MIVMLSASLLLNTSELLINVGTIPFININTIVRFQETL